MIFRDKIGKQLQVYIDNVLIYVRTYKECLKRMKKTMSILRAIGLTINLKKCQFMHQNLRYLCHIVGNGELRPDPIRVEAIYKLKEPRNVTDVHAMIGFLSYWQ